MLFLFNFHLTICVQSHLSPKFRSLDKSLRMQDEILGEFDIGFPDHFRHLCIQFHQCSIQFRPEKLTVFKSNVQFRQIVIHIRMVALKGHANAKD